MNFSRVGEGVFFIHPERVLRADACRQHGDPLHRAAASFNKALQCRFVATPEWLWGSWSILVDPQAFTAAVAQLLRGRDPCDFWPQCLYSDLRSCADAPAEIREALSSAKAT